MSRLLTAEATVAAADVVLSVPQGFTVKDQLKGVHDMLYADYQGEYHRVREKNGGVSPRIPVHMLDACWAHDRCYFGAEPDDYLYD